MQIHLDALGGVAGDMFAASLLHAFPEHEAGVIASIRAALPEVSCETLRHNDGILDGRRFVVARPGAPDHDMSGHRHAHHHGADHAHVHAHRPWSRIRDELQGAPLAPAVRTHAIGIFSRLAEAEARVHGIGVDAVAFHEVGAWDSIADIVAAAHLIAALEATAWSVSALPLGSGRVRTQHGPLPVPAPATSLLLEGFATLDDGIPGERVTPTGAAILRHLRAIVPPAAAGPRLLKASGIGFGTRTLPGISNCLRVLVYEEDEAAPRRSAEHRELGVIEFEVDDQSGEDLAMGLDRLRAHPDIFDVVQMPVFGKKGRMMIHVRALARASAIEGAIAACFTETTTIGLRHRIVSGAALPRRLETVAVEGLPVRVKIVARPDGASAKAEADDALAREGHAGRAALRRTAEAMALRDHAGFGDDA
ncbi:LarC family nickel insertion protein [Methylobacterium sp. J-068]|uniref:LarC family nickel insertion protein n=1 Tax=Methylobacterium sp. J-068 TaxID=2836649 RepID=UPI001FB89CC8|nr:LarC family nickel insertion protein [Methylobacterium sp. J-068]MCJ2037307.1 LarC family nickel insertion protein [Methylobacterium sp. J-068]